MCKILLIGDRLIINSLKTLFVLLLLLITQNGFSQGQNPINGTGPYSNMLNCTGAPTFSVNLTGQPAGTWTSNPQSRAGSCCTPPDNNCTQFSVTLDPAAVGILFSIPSGCGAAPSGSLFYQVNCGPLTTVGTPICLSGPGPYIITFCKPGGNANCYSITSIAQPSTSPDVITADGCTDTLTVTGVSVASTTWTSIAPGTTGQYNNYLNNLAGSQPGVSGTTYTGQTTVAVTPQPGYPATIQYSVCGNIIGGCGGATFCDTVSVSIYPALFAQINPLNPSICFGSLGTTLNAVPIGGAAPYNYLWTGPSNNGATTSTILASVPGVYNLSMTDATGCPSASISATVTQFANTITANAGQDRIVCRSPIPTITINGSVTGVTTGIWSGGAGTYSPSNTSLTLNYTPSAAELAAGTVTLTLTTTNNGSCPGASDQMVILLPQFTSTLSTVPTNITCNGLTNGAIDLTVTGGFAITGYLWSNSAITQDLTNLGVGTYSVSVTDVNGCIGVISQAITQPAILTSAITAQTNVLCFGGNTGSVTVASAGGTAAYQYSLNGGANQASGTFSGLIAGSYTVTITDANGCTTVRPVTITQPAAPLTLTFNQVNVLCFGASTGSINLTPAGATSPYTFAWSNGATTEDLSGLVAGTYTVNMNGANGTTGGCAATATITITQPAAPLTLTFTQVNVLCNGGLTGSIDITPAGGTPAYSYTWSNGATTQNISGLSAGTYSVTITDANGCTITASFTLTEPAVLNQNITSQIYNGGYNVSCNGASDGSITLSVTGGTPGYSYLWSNGATTQNVSGLSAGTYSVTITDANGCETSSIFTLTAPPVLSLDFGLSDFNGSNISCPGISDGFITLAPLGGTPGFTFLWNTGATTQNLSALSAGFYEVTVTDVLGCSVQQGFQINAPDTLQAMAFVTTNYNGSDISCYNADDGGVSVNIENGVPPYQTIWYNSANQEVCVCVSSENHGPDTYSVMVTDANGCVSNSNILLTQPEPMFIELTSLADYFGMAVSCEENADGSISVDFGGGTAGYTIQWQELPQFENDSTLENLSIGHYSVVIYDQNGCQISDNIILDAHPLPELIEITPSYYCLGEEVEITCGSASSDIIVWQFSNGYNSAGCEVIFSADQVGCFDAQITITSQFGCINTQNMESIYCVNPLPMADFSYTPNTDISFVDPFVYFQNNSENAETFSWNFGHDNSISNDVNPQHMFPDNGPGMYTVTLYAYSDFGCVDTTTQIITVIDELIFYVPNAFTPDGDEFNNDFLPIFSSGYDPQSYTFLIFNRWGEVLFESHNTEVGWDGTYGGKICQDGVYIWQIRIKESDKARVEDIKGHVTLIR